MPNPLNVPITPPRVAFIDTRTGNVSREWYMFLLSLYQSQGGSSVSLDDLQKGPPAPTVDEINELVANATANTAPSAESVIDQIAELRKQIDGLELQVRPELGTMSALQQNNLPWVAFDNTPENTPDDTPGTLYWDNADGNQTLNLIMAGGLTTQQIGEEQYYRIKASSAITAPQVVMFTGTVGASGALKGAPATGLTAVTALYVMGVATENIANNDWGYVTSFGLVRKVNTTGGAEAWVDGQVLYLDPTVPGGLTKNVPTAPNPKVVVASVVHAATNGSLFVRPAFGGRLGDFEGDVNISTPVNGDLLQYDGAQQRWENTPASTVGIGTATNLAGGTTGSVPYQSSASTTSMLAIGTASQVLQVNAGATAPEWVSSTGTGSMVRATSATLTTPKATTTIGVGNATPSASGAGITFPATISASSDANTLDDYEEGTWVPTWTGLTTSGSVSKNIGYYVKVGRIVYYAAFLQYTVSFTTTQGTTYHTLPFNPTVSSANLAANVSNATNIAGTGLTFSGSAVSYVPSVAAGITEVVFTGTYYST